MASGLLPVSWNGRLKFVSDSRLDAAETYWFDRAAPTAVSRAGFRESLSCTSSSTHSTDKLEPEEQVRSWTLRGNRHYGSASSTSFPSAYFQPRCLQSCAQPGVHRLRALGLGNSCRTWCIFISISFLLIHERPTNYSNDQNEQQTPDAFSWRFFELMQLRWIYPARMWVAVTLNWVQRTTCWMLEISQLRSEKFFLRQNVVGESGYLTTWQVAAAVGGNRTSKAWTRILDHW